MLFIFQDLVQSGIDNAYSTIVQANSGRIYVITGANLDNITKLPDGEPAKRTDEFGYFVMRWSDDGGATYSKDRVVLPYRTTAIDRGNSFSGKVKEFWNVDQTKIRNGSVYFMFTKIGTYIQVPLEY